VRGRSRARPTGSGRDGVDGVIELVDVVGPADQLPVGVVQRDEAVVREHQLADDAVHRPVELLHVARRARELGDAVQRQLDLLRALTLLLDVLQSAANVAEL